MFVYYKVKFETNNQIEQQNHELGLYRNQIAFQK